MYASDYFKDFKGKDTKKRMSANTHDCADAIFFRIYPEIVCLIIIADYVVL